MAYKQDDPLLELIEKFSSGGYNANSSHGSAAAAGAAIALVIAATTSVSHEEEKKETDAVALTNTRNSSHQEFFPENPLEFVPLGLIPRIYVDIGEKKGGIIKWEIPGTKIAKFEWNQDFKNGSHYHVMQSTWANQHLDPVHYRAGDPVPEPWNTFFFGYKGGLLNGV